MSALSLLFPSRDSDPTDLANYESEVANGLTNSQGEFDDAIRNQAMFDMDGDRYLTRRDSETPFDWEGREKRSSGITRQIIEILCSHLYAPGPMRKFSDPDADELLQRIWEQNQYNSLWNKSDQLSSLNDVVAVQCDAGEGKYEECPLTLRLWPREEFKAWTHPNDSRVVVALATIDRYDMTTVYRLWNDREVRTYKTQKNTFTSGGRVANWISTEPHEYGILPFYFVHYELPTTRFCTPGIGDFAAKAEIRVNDRLSRIDESVNKHLNPLAISTNLPPTWFPILEPQRFIRLTSSGKINQGASGYAPVGDPKLEYLSATIDVAGAWEDLAKYIVQVLEAVGVPQSAYRMDQTATASGIALVIEQLPLLTRAKKRRHPYSVFESNAAKVQLVCLGNHYNIPGLVEAAKTGKLTLQWPEFAIPVGTLDRNSLDESDMSLGVKSLIQVIQDRHGCTRDQAIEMLRQIAADKEVEAQIVGPAPAPAGGSSAGQVGGNGTTKALGGPAGGSEEKPAPGSDPDAVQGGSGSAGET